MDDLIIKIKLGKIIKTRFHDDGNAILVDEYSLIEDKVVIVNYRFHISQTSAGTKHLEKIFPYDDVKHLFEQ